MATELEDLRVLKTAEDIADGIWQQVSAWDELARDTVGKQMIRAADSVGANIAESYGRFHYGEKLQFLYFARGSLFEAKYWLNRAAARQLLPEPMVVAYGGRLSSLAHQLNRFAGAIKRQRATDHHPPSRLREPAPDYTIPPELPTGDSPNEPPLFTTVELAFIASIPLTADTQSPNLPIS